MGLLLQLLQLVCSHQLVLSFLVIWRALQLKTKQNRKKTKKKTGRFLFQSNALFWTFKGKTAEVLRLKLTTASKSSMASWVLPCFNRIFPLCNLAWARSVARRDDKKRRTKERTKEIWARGHKKTKLFSEERWPFWLRSRELTARKSGLSWMALVRSGRADLDFPIARNTAARL